MRPVDVATAEVYRFIDDHLRERPAHILEIGCGSGELAAQLQAAGHTVMALDASQDAVDKARQKGLDARRADWPDFDSDTLFDAILFTRSLHHIEGLDAALDRAERLLKPGGLLIADEFDFEATTRADVAWLYGTLRLLDACGHLRPLDDNLPSRLLRVGGDFNVWRRDHDLHSVPAMRGALAARFDLMDESRTTYLYRYVLPLLPDDEAGYTIAAGLLDAEQKLVEAEGLTKVGRRFAARKKT